MRKVLFLNLYDDPVDGGGAEVTLHHLTQGLVLKGLKVVILSTAAKSGLQKIEREGVRIWRAGLRNVYWPSRAHRSPAARIIWHMLDSYNLFMQPILRRVLEIEQPDVVSMHNLPGWSSLAWLTIANMNIPSVQVLHDSYAICPKTTMFNNGRNCSEQCTMCRLLRLRHRRLSSRVSAVVGVSRFILDRHLKHGYFRDVPIREIIHNTRDAGELGLDIPPPVRKPGKDSVRLGFIGRLDPTKGAEQLLETFIKLQNPKVELWIAGSGKPAYEQSLRMRYSSERVHFLGHIAPRDFYPRVDAVVVPSLWQDTFPGVVFEALAFGKPVIGSRRGGIPEMIHDGENGLLFDPEGPGQLTAALQRLTEDAALRADMSKTARMSAERFLDRNAWVASYLNLYKEVARRPSR